MSSNYTLALILCFFSCVTHAESLHSLKSQNEKLLSLKAELEIAKTKAELEKTRFESMAISNANAPKPVKTSPQAELDIVELVGVGGDANAPVGSFVVGGGTVTKRLGENLNGWTLQRLTATEAGFTKTVQVKQGKKTAEEKYQRSIYLATHNRATQPIVRTMPFTTPSTAMTVPAVAPDLRQIK